jgi:Cu2+-exporting ATPase
MTFAASTAPRVQERRARNEQIVLAVDNIECAGCMTKIERAVNAMPGVESARFNLTSRRLAVEAERNSVALPQLIAELETLGYAARPYAPDEAEVRAREQESRLIRALAVAGFGAANIMLLSVAIWSGGIQDMQAETRDLFHWVSALIALPVVAYSGQPFFESAFSALRARRLNMDVPISLAVLLALVMSVIETAGGGQEAYFDSAVMLLFFLLIGRVLEMQSRSRMRSLGQNLLALQKPTVAKLDAGGSVREIAASEIRAGDRILVAPGNRIGVDGIVVGGTSNLDDSLVTGESAPKTLRPGDRVYAGTLNLSGALTVQATTGQSGTLLAEIGDLLERATAQRGRYRRLADRAAALYAPLVHGLAAVTFVGWMVIGAGWQPSLLNAITVLIITCPCALGLAVPAVQAVATSALFRRGVLVNSGDALERLAEVDTVIFDKTGTLTDPRCTLQNSEKIPAAALTAAARLAHSSHHVLARALARLEPDVSPIIGAQELAGAGVVAQEAGAEYRLGSRLHCDAGAADDAGGLPRMELWFRKDDMAPVVFLFDQHLKSDARGVVDELRKLGMDVRVLSGDREAAVLEASEQLGISCWSAAADPKEKIERVGALRAAGHNVLMVGDGLNDAAALQAANVSAAPATALDITQSAADIIVIGERLEPLLAALNTGRKARRLMLQNFALAGVYNAIAIPLAVAGLVTPLMAALFMSGSSIVVTLNALRAASSKGRSAWM